MKKERTRRIFIIVFVIIVAAITIRLGVQQMNHFTGVATVQTANILLNVSKVPSQPQIMGKGQKSAQPSTVKEGLRIEPINVAQAFTISTFVGKKESRQFYIKNLGDLPTEIVVTSTVSIIKFEPVKTRLKPDEETAIEFLINTEKPGVYAGKITIKGTFVTREIPIAVTIRSVDTGLSLNAELRSTTVAALDEIIADIEIHGANKGVVELEYTLKDANNKAVIRVTEKRAIRYATALTKRIAIPANLKAGTYLFAIEAQYEGKISMFSELVKVTRKPVQEKPIKITDRGLSPFIIILLVIGIALLNIIVLKRKPKLLG